MAGCSSQTGFSGNGRLSDLLDVSSWTLNSRLPENNDDGGATDIVMSTEEQTPEPFPPLVTDQARSKQSPQTIAIDTALASLPPATAAALSLPFSPSSRFMLSAIAA